MEMETEAWPEKKPRISHNDNNLLKMKMKKSQLCRRFKCNSELRRFHQQPKLCRLFFLYNHCSYGHSCRFLHSTPPSPNPNNISPPQLLPQLGKFDCYSSAECRKMQTSTAATVTNASTTTVATSAVHKNEPYGVVKCIFKKNELQRISRIYADWI